MKFLRILLLPLLSILLVSENHALEHLYSPPLGVSSSVKNNAQTDKMAKASAWLAERNKQMVMEGGASDGMGKEDPLDHRFLDGKHYDFDLPWDEKAFRQALAEKCAKNPAWQAYKEKGDDVGRRKIENDLEKEAMQSSWDFFQGVNDRAAAARQRFLMEATRIGSYFIHPIVGITYKALLDKKVPVWDDTKTAYQHFGEEKYGQAACHAGMAVLDTAALGKTGKALWIGVRRWGGMGNTVKGAGSSGAVTGKSKIPEGFSKMATNYATFYYVYPNMLLIFYCISYDK
ncbi:MAG: hypothetical protein K2X94_03100 [Amoebophilaceae bacterium]|nr:hypothetical protein [Amoebophilaceae bacterium]